MPLNDNQYYVIMHYDTIVGVEWKSGTEKHLIQLKPLYQTLENILLIRKAAFKSGMLTNIKTTCQMLGYDYDLEMKNASGLNLTDGFWYHKINKKQMIQAILFRNIQRPTWKEKNYFENDFELGCGYYNHHMNLISPEVRNKMAQSPDFCTRGAASKYWAIENGKRYLYKFPEHNAYANSLYLLELIQGIMSILNESLFIATNMTIDLVHYEFNRCGKAIISAKSECFCDENTELILLPLILNDYQQTKDITKYDAEQAQYYIEFLDVLGWILSNQISTNHLGILKNRLSKKTKIAPLFGIDEVGSRTQTNKIVLPDWIKQTDITNLREYVNEYKNQNERYVKQECEIILNNLDLLLYCP